MTEEERFVPDSVTLVADDLTGALSAGAARSGVLDALAALPEAGLHFKKIDSLARGNTAFDIAGKGIASAQSMIEAIGLAHRLADHRAGGRTPERGLGT